SAINKSEFENWSEDEQLAFLINAYNAWTVNLVLTGYPKIDSIRDLGNIIFTPFGKDIVSLFGEQISLDDIEKDLILNNFKESRIHFALNCASISCPSLKTEAYDGERLEKQLHDQMATFLSDKKRNYLDGNNLRVSSIFKWYDDDFEDSDASINEIEDYFIKHSELFDSSSADTQKIKSGEFKIKFLKYDWNLNKRN
ncbi:MAG: DUF547 domain-containing protein, partial [Kordiimonadaceae bacterium]|nr:DUF547 domain-containing protein [Kordiimonadaceae bacterium]